MALTKRYFAFLGETWLKSVLPTCQPADRNLPHPTKVLTYTSAREDLQFVLGLIGEDPTGYSEHSSKRGGATEAARLGAPMHDIQLAGQWSSTQTASLYVDNPLPTNQILRPYLS